MMNQIKNIPLAHQLTTILGAPLYPSLMTCAALIVLASLIVLRIDSTVMSLLILSGMLFVFFTYAMGIAHHFAKGHMTPPDWGTLLESLSGYKIIQHMLLSAYLILSFYFYVSQEFYGIALLSSALLVFFMPSILVLAYIEKTVFTPTIINKVFKVIKDLSTDYVLLIIHLVVMLAISLGVSIIVSSMSPNIVAFITGIFCLIYSMLSYYCLMGNIIHRNQRILNLTPNEKKAQLHKPCIQPLMETAQEKIATEDYYGASLVYEKIIAIDGLNLTYHQSYHELLLQVGDKEKLKIHCRNYIRKLLAQNQSLQAISIYKTALKCLPDFHLKEIDVAITFAEIMRNEREYRLATTLLTHTKIQFEDDPNLAEAYFLLGKILSENLDEDEQAKKMLTHALIQFPNHPLRNKIKAHLDCLMKL